MKPRAIPKRIAQLLTRVFAPQCPGGCRQRVGHCSCSWLPPLPDDDLDELND